jgi:DNA gyrase subunit A
MAKRKKQETAAVQPAGQAHIENAGVVAESPITTTLVDNYMPYAMSVIVSRALPEIDGFKPSHRKILYTMFRMGLMTGNRVKSANAVGEVMKLHPHGDQAIYETMVRLSRGNESLLHAYIDSKGNFGKSYSRDMAFAAARYTEVKLSPICSELFVDIEHDTVDMVDNYDGTRKEPTLLPVRFPTVLVNANVGIAVSMASAICPFNLSEVCQTTIELIKNPDHNIIDTLPAPDFPIGGKILHNADEMKKIVETGRGTVRVQSRWHYDKTNNCIEITEIPSTTTIEAIIEKIVELVKSGRVKEISDIRDETDLKGLKITIDLKRGVDPSRLMTRLYRMTPIEDSFSCNFNVLIAATPRVMGVRELLNEWIAFRFSCVRRRIYFDLTKKREKLHLLQGLQKILLDIDRAIKIVRETTAEQEVVPNLMIGFGIDEIQAEYVAEIRLRYLNREYILKRTEETKTLLEEIGEMQKTLNSREKILQVITDELQAASKKYGQPRKSEIVQAEEQDEDALEDAAPDYAVMLFLTKEGYFKKITPQSWRMSFEHKLKEGDVILQAIEGTNRMHLLFFSDKGQVYKAAASDFEDTKASALGEFIPAKLGFEEEENVIFMAATPDYQGWMLFGFDNGKIAKVDLNSYETKTKRKKLTGAYSVKSQLVGMVCIANETVIRLDSSNGKTLLINTARLPSNKQRGSQGVSVMRLMKKAKMSQIILYEDKTLKNEHRYTATSSLPSSGAPLRTEDVMEQTTFLSEE